jgi:hypothetical protein
MRWRLFPLLLVAGVVLVGSPGCSSCSDAPDRQGGGAAPVPSTGPDRARARPGIQRGRFADAVRVGVNRWQLLRDAPPPLERDGDLSGDGDAGGGNGGDGGGRRHPGGEKKKRFGQSPIYLDGVPIAVATYGELPPWLATRWVALGDGRKVIRFVFADYLTALGIPLGRVQSVQLHGGRGRVGIIAGDELRRVRDTLLFSFTRGEGGVMRMHWDGDAQVSDSIDKVRAVAVYVERRPPRWDRGAWGLVDEVGVEFEGIPYAEAPLKGGVRIYLDGRIAHVFKRNRSFERAIAPARTDGSVPVFGLHRYLGEVGVEATRIAALELLQENRVALRLEGRALAAERARLEIAAPPQSSGRLRVALGPPASRRSLEVTAINLYTASRARAHQRRQSTGRCAARRARWWEDDPHPPGSERFPSC